MKNVSQKIRPSDVQIIETLKLNNEVEIIQKPSESNNKITIFCTTVGGEKDLKRASEFLLDEKKIAGSGEEIDHARKKNVISTVESHLRNIDSPFTIYTANRMTEGCDGVQYLRFNPETFDNNLIDLSHECKMSIKKEGKNYHVVITPANYNESGSREGVKANLADLGLVQYAVNPFNTLEVLGAKCQKDGGSINVYFNDLAMKEAGFICNNVGHNLLSCVVDAKEYVNGINSAIKEVSNLGVDIKVYRESEKYKEFKNAIKFYNNEGIFTDEMDYSVKSYFTGELDINDRLERGLRDGDKIPQSNFTTSLSGKTELLSSSNLQKQNTVISSQYL